jgi:prepilin-type N-terminal cleavage/methylation domain-containing protein
MDIRKHTRGFTLVELLLVISIIVLLLNTVLPVLNKGRDKAYYARALGEFRSVEASLQQYLNDNGTFPPDANRDIPPGLEEYLAPGIWPDAAWPGSVFDWENWNDPVTGEKIYQISVRFCPIGQPTQCRFPNDDWAANFDINSAVYYCIQGPCRSHLSYPVTHPGYCVNCEN